MSTNNKNTVSSANTKTQLKISVCTLNSKGVPSPSTKKSDCMSVMANPNNLTRDYNINYSSDTNGNNCKHKEMGSISPEPKFSSYDPETLSFELLFDGTGVISENAGTTTGHVDTDIKNLQDIVYNYVGKNHQPNVVQIAWGKLIFFGRAKSMNSKISLFQPDGDSLRATVSLSFVRYMCHATEVKISNKSSPDLTHMILVKDGDTLPLLCHKIYQNSSYYTKIARFNGLNSFMDLSPGMTLYFPPLS